MPHRNQAPRLGDDPRLLEWLTLIMLVVLFGAVIAYGQVMAERQAILQEISTTNQQILRQLELNHPPAGEPMNE